MPTGTTEFIDRTSADVFIPEVWSPLAIIAREQKTVFSQRVDRRYEPFLSRGDVVHVPSIGLLAARTKTINTAITYETITETNTDITVTTHDYAAIAVESIAKVQTNRDMLVAYASMMGYALALAVDDALAAHPDDFTNALGTLAVENTMENFIRAIQYLDDANAPPENRCFIIAPAAVAGLLKLTQYISSDYEAIHGTGPRKTGLEFAYLRSLFQIPVYVTTNVEGTNAAGHDNTLFQRDSIALVMQMRPTMRHMYDIDYFADKVAIEQVYGSAILRNDHGVFLRGA